MKKTAVLPKQSTQAAVSDPEFATVGRHTGDIDVRISYRIIQLFSEGLYKSPTKAVEELVANSFDAGASRVHVLISPDLSTPESSIVVIDDGQSMDKAGLADHWLIGVSKKRDRGYRLPRKRKQIGRFGIGKLATYVLANRLTHICKIRGSFYSTSMNYQLIPSGSGGGIVTDEAVRLPLRELSEAEAKQAVAPWISGQSEGHKALRLFGADASKNWTVAILSDLKEMAGQLRLGRPSGKTVTTAYDAADRVLNVNGPMGAYASLNSNPVQAYWPDGKIAQFTYGSGVTESRSYDQNTYLPTGVTVASGGTTLLQLTLGYSLSPTNNGNIISQLISAPSAALPATLQQCYYYDPINRISAEVETQNTSGTVSCPTTPATTGDTASQTYGFDAFGNMSVTAGALATQCPTGGVCQTPTSSAQFTNNQWTNACVSTPCYDASGNQLGLAGDVFSYDAENRMISANVQNMGVTTYGYDGEGRRVWKSNSTNTTAFAYDAAGILTAEYSITPPIDSGTQYITTDQLGSTRLIASGSTALARFDYVPFGQEIPSGYGNRGTGYGPALYPNSTDIQDVKFTGKERDAESGLDYFGARYLSSSMGRWMSPDWSAKEDPVPAGQG